jgi:hypothetical protein
LPDEYGLSRFPMSGSFSACTIAAVLAFRKSLSFAARGLPPMKPAAGDRFAPRAYQDASGRAYESVPVTHFIVKDVSIACILPEVTEECCSISRQPTVVSASSPLWMNTATLSHNMLVVLQV